MTIDWEQETTPLSPLPKASAHPRALACLNALAHGGTANQLLLPGEDAALLDTLFDEAFAEHQPATTAHAALVAESVEAQWLLWRRQRAHLNFEFNLYSKDSDPIRWSKEEFHTLELLDRYKTHAERALRRALVNVNSLRNQALKQQHWLEQLGLYKEKVAQARDKLELAKAKDTRLAPKQAAEALLDARLAQDSLDHRREQDEIIAEATAERAAGHIYFSEPLNCHVIKQTIKLTSYDNGAAWIDSISPDHDEVRRIIQNSDQYLNPPAFVLREFKFDGFIPNEYRFLLDLGHKLPVHGNRVCEHHFDFESFTKLAETERKILARQPRDES
jgi:hypothetical protein